ncbi:MAG: helix-turn-helix transcriptional regulator [Pseudonocardiales bacterium]|nr:helix-turn-helix transcriptional regulator [Pseudonocardiales bacterium]MBV9730455.1 helix-turn-helix transcriptional regulator [Pseudonocardiales bacterium]
MQFSSSAAAIGPGQRSVRAEPGLPASSSAPQSRHQRLAARRWAAGLSQEQLAERLSVDCSTVTRWESGETVSLPRAPRFPPTT